MSERPEPAPEKVYLHDVPLARAWDRFRAALAEGGLWRGVAEGVGPIEEVEPVGATDRGRATEAVLLRAAVAPWSHVRALGEDMVVTELVLSAGPAVRPVDL